MLLAFTLPNGFLLKLQQRKTDLFIYIMYFGILLLYLFSYCTFLYINISFCVLFFSLQLDKFCILLNATGLVNSSEYSNHQQRIRNRSKLTNRNHTDIPHTLHTHSLSHTQQQNGLNYEIHREHKQIYGLTWW